MNIAQQKHILSMGSCQCREIPSMRFEEAYRTMLRKERRKTILTGLATLSVMALSVFLPLAWIALR